MEKVNAVIRKITGCKKASAGFFIKLKTGMLYPDTADVEINREARTCLIYNTYAGKMEETIFFSWDEKKSVWHRKIKNISGKNLPLEEAGIFIRDIDFGKRCLPENDYFYHVENPRIYKMMAIPVDGKLDELLKKSTWHRFLAKTGGADPGVTTERIGASPYYPFTAVLLSNHEVERGIVHGSLSQKVFYHNYSFRHAESGVAWEIFSSVKSVNFRDFIPGETIDDHWYLGSTESAGSITNIFDEYLGELRSVLPLGRQRTINRHSVVWGSGNDGIGKNIDQKSLLKNAEFLRDNFPTVEWIQIDFGYGASRGFFSGGLSVPYEGEKGTNVKKFPEGLGKFADKIKQLGLKPAIWISGMADEHTLIVRDHPEWFIDRMSGKKIKPGENIGNRETLHSPKVLMPPTPALQAFMDVSMPEVREYMKYAIGVFLTEYGFEGIKHDFWSYAFEDTRPLLSRKEKTGYEWRTWWLSELRRRLPAYGYIQTGMEITMGNPFLGEYFSNYRYGIDILHGRWHNFETNMLWGAACFATHSGDLFIPNNDAIAILAGLNDAEALSWINYCIVSRSLIEIAGWLYKKTKHPRLYWIKKAICCPNNGQDVFFCDYDYRKTHRPPDKWYFCGAHFSLVQDHPCLPMRTAAVFNLSDATKNFRLDYRQLGLPKREYSATNVWTTETSDLQDYKDISIEPHGSILLAVNKKEAEIQVLDSDMKIEDLFFEKKNLSLKIAYRGNFQIIVSHKPKKVRFAEKSAFIKTVKGKNNWAIKGSVPCGGWLNISF